MYHDYLCTVAQALRPVMGAENNTPLKSITVDKLSELFQL
jgi:hypothetical protein